MFSSGEGGFGFQGFGCRIFVIGTCALARSEGRLDDLVQKHPGS